MRVVSHQEKIKLFRRIKAAPDRQINRGFELGETAELKVVIGHAYLLV